MKLKLKIASVATVLSLLAGCGIDDRMDAHEQAYDDSRQDGQVEGDTEVTLEELGGPTTFDSEEEQRERMGLSVLEAEIRKAEAAAKINPTSENAVKARVEAVKKQAVRNAVLWKVRFFDPNFRTTHASFFNEGKSRFTKYYGVSGDQFKGYVFGADAVLASSGKEDFNELLGSDCSHFVQRVFHNALPKGATIPFLPTEYLLDVIYAYLEVEKDQPMSMDPVYKKQLALVKYKARLEKKRDAANVELKKKGQLLLGERWMSTHLDYFNYFDYVQENEAQPGDYVVFPPTKANEGLFARSHVYLLRDPSSKNIYGIGAQSGKIGIEYAKYPKNKYFLRPNVKLVVEKHLATHPNG